jgi:hypothetical protein
MAMANYRLAARHRRFRQSLRHRVIDIQRQCPGASELDVIQPPVEIPGLRHRLAGRGNPRHQESRSRWGQTILQRSIDLPLPFALL